MLSLTNKLPRNTQKGEFILLILNLLLSTGKQKLLARLELENPTNMFFESITEFLLLKPSFLYKSYEYLTYD